MSDNRSRVEDLSDKELLRAIRSRDDHRRDYGVRDLIRRYEDLKGRHAGLVKERAALTMLVVKQAEVLEAAR